MHFQEGQWGTRRCVPAGGGRNRRGTSLIEVLVVLVILVLGILSIARLFPGGFLVVRAAENATYADRLAQSAIEALKINAAGLPEGIYTMYVDGMYTEFDPNVRPDDLSPYQNNAAYNDINKARYISNETITIPAARPLSNGATASLYIADFGPIDTSIYGTGSILSANSLPWTAKSGSSQLDYANGAVQQYVEEYIDNPADELTVGQPQYLVDYNAGQIAVPPAAYTQSFTLTLTINKALYTLSLTVPPSGGSGNTGNNYNGGWFSPTDASLNYVTASQPSTLPAGPWDAGSTVLVRPFHAPSGSTFDSDPYEYQLYNPSSIGTNVNMGVFAFNPLAAGLKAQISYITLDWHILHDDVDVPQTGTDNTVHLTLNNLKKVGDIQSDQMIYNGLFNDANNQDDIVMLDRDTGAVMPLSEANSNTTYDLDTTSPSTTAVPAGAVEVSYQAGRITVPSSLSGRHLRVFYAGDADWALAVQKAPSLYTRNDAGPLQVAQYSVGSVGSRVYFPLCDAGKTVEFDGITYPTVSGNTMQTQRLSTYTAPISQAKDGTGVYVDLPITGTPSAISFEAVRGISAKAVVIYKDRGSWKTHSVDTLLTQPPTPAGE